MLGPSASFVCYAGMTWICKRFSRYTGMLWHAYKIPKVVTLSEINISRDKYWHSLSDLDRAGNWRVGARVREQLVSTSQWQWETQNVSQNQDPDIKHYRDMIIGRMSVGRCPKLQTRSLWPAIRILKTLYSAPKCTRTDGYEIYPRFASECRDRAKIPVCWVISTPAILQRNRGQSPLLR